jgi:hypothetical protein
MLLKDISLWSLRALWLTKAYYESISLDELAKSHFQK